MRKVTFGGASSLDNYFARGDHSVDWLMWSDEAAQIMSDYWKNVDTILMGRKTYEVSIGRAKSAKKPYGGTPTYVFSRTLQPGRSGNVTIVADDAGAFVQRLKQQPGKDICLMGGGELGSSLLESGVVDEVGFNIHPILLGTGIPALCPMRRQVDLELIDCKRFTNGCVTVTYRVKR